MDFVDADGRRKGLMLRAMIGPILVLPRVALEVPDHRRGARPKLGSKAERVSFVDAVLRKPRADAVLVQRALADARDETFPDARRAACIKRRDFWVPLVEFADHADRVGIRRPDRERHPVFVVDLRRVSAEFFVDAGMSALVREVEVEIRQQATGGARSGLGGLQHWYPQSQRLELFVARSVPRPSEAS